jgi:hypothetical protein
LRQKLVPEIEGEVVVSAAEAGDEMVFESLDVAFSPVATMKAGRSQLVVNVFIGHEVFEELRGLLSRRWSLGWRPRRWRRQRTVS